MITGFIINAVYVLFYNIVNVLPAGGSMPAAVLSAASSLGALMHGWNSVLPVSELLSVIGLIIALKIGVLAVRVVLWLVSTIRGSGLSGHGA